MSVQAGIWNFDSKPANPNLIADFSKFLTRQGPDSEFSYVDGPVALLYRQFHTTAESRREKQPYFSRRGFVLTWDGRLDNRDELIVEYRPFLDAHPTDVSIVAAAYDHQENNCFRHITGDWAVSIWKPQQRELLFAVDYMAIRHIFYYLKQDRIWWATDLAPLVLLSGDKFHIDDDYIAGYFAHEPNAHLTPYREIRQVPAGQLVRVRDGKASIERYWRFSAKSRIRYKIDAEYEEHFRHVFRQSVRRRLRSDSPILAELSGGLDSSSIVCMADDILANEGATTPRLDTLSYYDKTEPQGDDWIYFLKVEQNRGRMGHHIDVSKLGETLISLECKDFSPLPGCLGVGRQIEAERAAVVRGGRYRVTLAGTGGDEFLGGVSNPAAHLADSLFQLRLVRLAKQLTAWSLVKRRPWIHLLGHAIADVLPASVGQYLLEQAQVEPWIEKKFAKRTKLGIHLLDVDEHFGLWLPTRRSYIGGVLLMGNKLAKWKSPLSAFEETRHPYLDENLIDFILSIPASQILRPGERRSLMRRALIGIVPREILCRQTKQVGARTPLVLLERNWEELQSCLTPFLSSSLGYINRARFSNALQSAKIGRQVSIVQLFRGIALELWLQHLSSRCLINLGTMPPASPSTAPLRASVRSDLHDFPRSC